MIRDSVNLTNCRILLVCLFFKKDFIIVVLICVTYLRPCEIQRGIGTKLKIQNGERTENRSECWKRNCLEIVLN